MALGNKSNTDKKFSDEHRQKISNSLKGIGKPRGLDSPMYGRKKTQEQIELNRIAQERYKLDHANRFTFTCRFCGVENKSAYKRTTVCDFCRNEERPCLDGCGIMVVRGLADAKYINGHHKVPKGRKASKETRAKMVETAARNKEKRSIQFTFVCKICNTEKYSSVEWSKICKECKELPRLCACGCNRFTKLGKYGTKYINGHYKGNLPGYYQHTDETKAQLRDLIVNGPPRTVRNSKQEIEVSPKLEELGYTSSALDGNYPIHYDNRLKLPDFYDTKNKRVLEIFGTYWHRDRKLPNGLTHETPKKLIKWYKSAGWECIVLWEDEVDEWLNNQLPIDES